MDIYNISIDIIDKIYQRQNIQNIYFVNVIQIIQKVQIMYKIFIFIQISSNISYLHRSCFCIDYKSSYKTFVHLYWRNNRFARKNSEIPTGIQNCQYNYQDCYHLNGYENLVTFNKSKLLIMIVQHVIEIYLYCLHFCMNYKSSCKTFALLHWRNNKFSKKDNVVPMDNHCCQNIFQDVYCLLKTFQQYFSITSQ